MLLKNLNLNDLLALDALLGEKHVTRAAKRSGVSQSAMSHTLARLRDQLRDPLLVRGSAGLELSPRAARLGVVVGRALAELEQALFEGGDFDPATTTRTFCIACVDLVLVPLVKELLAIFEREAPGAKISIQPLESRQFRRQIEDDELDVAILGPETTPGLRRSALYTEDSVLVMRRGHPAVRRPITTKVLDTLSHAVIIPHQEMAQLVSDRQGPLGYRGKIVLRMPYFVAGTMAIATSDLVMFLPRRLAEGLTSILPIVVRELPVRVPMLEVVQVWHPRQDGDPAHRWLRSTIERCFAPGGKAPASVARFPEPSPQKRKRSR